MGKLSHMTHGHSVTAPEPCLRPSWSDCRDLCPYWEPDSTLHTHLFPPESGRKPWGRAHFAGSRMESSTEQVLSQSRLRLRLSCQLRPQLQAGLLTCHTSWAWHLSVFAVCVPWPSALGPAIKPQLRPQRRRLLWALGRWMSQFPFLRTGH